MATIKKDENIKLVEIGDLSVESHNELEVGTAEWFLQVFKTATGFFEYDVVKQTWYVNQVAKKFLRECVKEETKGANLFENETLNDIVERFLLSPNKELTQEILLRHLHEHWQKFVLKCEKVFDNNGELKIRGLFLDISLENNNDRIDNQLQKLQAMGQLTSGVSHDFNNQLNGILGYVALMKNLTQDETLLRYMNGIERSVHHSTELTKKLLAFSHKADDKRSNLDLVQIVNDTVSMLKHTVDRRIKMELNIEDNKYNVLGDSSQINNAILNLCINARDAIKKNGVIELRLSRKLLEDIPDNLLSTKIVPNDYAILKIRDTGSGIEKELLPKIFKPFFTTKEIGKGTGMGLSGVVDAVRSHNGALTVESTVGKGTTFTIYLPINHGIDEKISEGIVSLGVGKLLLIDDEASNLEITHELLESFGYSVDSFSDPKLAIEHYAKNLSQYDCVLLDVIMPEMSGVEAFKAIKLINPTSKIILLTGVSEPYELDFILRQGADAYVPKPVDHLTLSSGVYRVLNPSLIATKKIDAEKLLSLDSPLNISFALERIAGNAQLYMKIAYNFRKEFYMIVEQLEQLIDSNLTEAIRKVHTIKGLAGQIGADELYEYSRELERNLNENKNYEEILSIFLEEFMEVTDELIRLEKYS